MPFLLRTLSPDVFHTHRALSAVQSHALKVVSVLWKVRVEKGEDGVRASAALPRVTWVNDFTFTLLPGTLELCSLCPSGSCSRPSLGCEL